MAAQKERGRGAVSGSGDRDRHKGLKDKKDQLGRVERQGKVLGVFQTSLSLFLSLSKTERD